MDDWNREPENVLSSLLHRLNILRPIAFAQFARVTSRELDEEAKRRRAVLERIDDIKRRLQSLPAEDTPIAKLLIPALRVQIEVIAKEIEETEQKDGDAAELATQEAMQQWIQCERDQKARRATQGQVQLKAAIEQETEKTLLEKARHLKAERKKIREIKPEIVPLLRQILAKKVAAENLDDAVEHEWENLRRGLYR